jgi:arylsulfatase A-like enzyme
VRTLTWLALAAAVVPVSCSIFGGGARPNLLVITVDSLRYDALSRSIGAAKTPSLRALENEGQSFTHCFSHSPATLPAHVALLSARLPHQSGVTTDGVAIDPEVTLLAEWMHSRGYSTAAAVGSSALWPLPGDDDPKNDRIATGLDRGFGSYAISESELAPASEVTERLLAQLDALPPNQPWFLFAQYSEPHAPYEAHGGPEVRAEVRLDGQLLDTPLVSEGGVFALDVELSPGRHELVLQCASDIEVRRLACYGPSSELATRFLRGKRYEVGRKLVVELENPDDSNMPVTIDAWVHDVPDLATARERYKLEVEAVDRAIGELVEALKERGLYENTTIVLTAPHGEALGEHGVTGHAANLHDEVLRVPMIVKPHRGCADFVELARMKHDGLRQIDIVPTVLDLLDLRAMPGAEGVSMLAEADRTHFAEVHPPDAPNTMLSRRDDRYKLIYTAGEDRWTLYDLTSDTLEFDDVFEVQGHFRATWQQELGALASSSPEAVNARMGMATGSDEPGTPEATR